VPVASLATNAFIADQLMTNVSFTVTAGSGALTIALKDANGNDPTAATPISLYFRNVNLLASPNTPTLLKVAAAASITMPSGSTLGIPSATACRVWIVGWNDGGTFRLGVYRATRYASVSGDCQVYPLTENGIGSSTLVSASATAAGTHYTAGAGVSAKAFRVLGYVEWGPSGMTPGTWTTTNLIQIQTFGPGIPLPGGNVQGPAGKYTNGGNSSVTLTITSAANPIRTSGCYQGSGPASTNVSWLLQRGSTTLLQPVQFEGTASAAQTLASGPFLDFPNAAGSTAYNATNSTFSAIGWSNVEAQEIMG
jgi:hypothetical protein